MFRFCALAFLLVGLAACESGDNIDPAVVNLYVELRVASVEYGTSPEARIARQNALRQYGFTAEQFEHEIDHIRANPELWKHFQQAILDRLDSLQGTKTPKPRAPRLIGAHP